MLGTSQIAPPWQEGLGLVGLPASKLRVEAFRTDGTNNYLANLNSSGRTWAGALRLPARGAPLSDFLGDKHRALSAVAYLLPLLREPVDVGGNCALHFEGYSTLVEAKSTSAFLREQSAQPPLILVDQVMGREKVIKAFDYPDALDESVREYIAAYDGPYYLSRGAPAWETLEEFPDCAEAAAHALAVLHRLTGSGRILPESVGRKLLARASSVLRQHASVWAPRVGSKEDLGLQKSLRKWQAENGERRTIAVLERFLRSSAGHSVVAASIQEDLAAEEQGSGTFRSFIHGDAHGGNFVVVDYEFRLSPHASFVDREFINALFRSSPELNAIGVAEIDNRIIHDLPSSSDHPRILAKRDHHRELHLIDLDGGRGTTAVDKESHLLDALVFAVSMENICELFGRRLDAARVLHFYYEGLEHVGQE